jgi:branched-chain amino acid transport system substrate-binding protein
VILRRQIINIRCLFKLAGILYAAIFLSGCGKNTNDVTGTLKIGLSYPAAIVDSSTYLREGLDFALTKINSTGGVLGRPVEILFIDDKDDPNIAMQVVDNFSNNGIQVVIGHWSSDVCYYAEDIYEKESIVMLSPNATSTNLFHDAYKYIFCMLPNNDEFARYMAEFAAREGLRRISVFYNDDEFGRDLAWETERAFKRYGILVVDRVSVLTAVSAETIFYRWDAFGCDGVIVAADLIEAIEPIRLIREYYPDIPILSSESGNKQTTRDALGSAARKVFTTNYDLSAIDPEFYQAYIKTFSHDPDMSAITAYVILYLLTDAMNRTQRTDSGAIAEWLKSIRDYDTVMGRISYNEATHSFEGQPVYIVEVTR